MITVLGSFAMDPPPLPAVGGTVLTAACPTADGRQRHRPGSGSGPLGQPGANARPGRSHDLDGSAQRAAERCVGVLVASMEEKIAPATRRACAAAGQRIGGSAPH